MCLPSLGASLLPVWWHKAGQAGQREQQPCKRLGAAGVVAGAVPAWLWIPAVVGLEGPGQVL